MRKKLLYGFAFLFFVAITTGAIVLVIKQSSNQGPGPAEQDTLPPAISMPISDIVTLQPRTSFIIESNENVQITNKDKYKLFPVESETENKRYVLEIFNTALGRSTPKIELQDDAGNKVELVPEIRRDTFSFPLGLKDIPEFEPYIYVDGNDIAANVKKGVKLYTTFEPTDLVDLNKDKLLYTNAVGIKLRSEAADYLVIMLNQLRKDTGKDLVIASGYRSYTNQLTQYSNWVRQLGLEEADKISARPGYSEHQLGTVIDFMSQDSGFDFTTTFADTVAGQWLAENSYKYGYVLSYPQGKESETGYSYEPWHYRYIGADLATEYHSSGMVLNKFLSGE